MGHTHTHTHTPARAPAVARSYSIDESFTKPLTLATNQPAGQSAQLSCSVAIIIMVRFNLESASLSLFTIGGQPAAGATYQCLMAIEKWPVGGAAGGAKRFFPAARGSQRRGARPRRGAVVAEGAWLGCGGKLVLEVRPGGWTCTGAALPARGGLIRCSTKNLTTTMAIP